MDKYKEAIHRYEASRQLLSTLKSKRSDLILECGSIERMATIGNPLPTQTGTLCLVSVHEVLLDTIQNNYGEGYSYDEILENERYEGNCCEACYESYQIKKGPLAEAKKEFGNAKRALSHIGKKLIEEIKNNDQ